MQAQVLIPLPNGIKRKKSITGFSEKGAGATRFYNEAEQGGGYMCGCHVGRGRVEWEWKARHG